MGITLTNRLNQSIHETIHTQSTESSKAKVQAWPLLPGKYFDFNHDPSYAVAVTTLASEDLAESLACIKPEGLCLVGKTETENIGIEKVIKNIITNPRIRFLIVAGKESQGHYSGKTLLALYENGVN